MTVKTITNGYEVSTEIEDLMQKFEYGVNLLFTDFEVEHFFYGSKVVMTRISGGKPFEYADFNITAKGIHLNGGMMSIEHYEMCKTLTVNDECFCK